MIHTILSKFAFITDHYEDEKEPKSGIFPIQQKKAI